MKKIRNLTSPAALEAFHAAKGLRPIGRWVFEGLGAVRVACCEVTAVEAARMPWRQPTTGLKLTKREEWPGGFWQYYWSAERGVSIGRIVEFPRNPPDATANEAQKRRLELTLEDAKNMLRALRRADPRRVHHATTEAANAG